MFLVIFDVDGTLTHSDRRDSYCFAQTYEHIYQKAFPTIDWTQYPHVTDTSIFSTLIKNHFDREVLSEEVAHFQQHYIRLLQENRRHAPHHFQEIPGARAMMQQLQAMPQQFQISIATGGWQLPARVKLDHVGILNPALRVHGADGKLVREAILSEAIEQAGGYSAFERIVYVGDAEWDVATTRNMQLDFVGVRRSGDLQVLESLGAKQVITDFQHIEAFFFALNEASVPDFPKAVGKLSFEDCG